MHAHAVMQHAARAGISDEAAAAAAHGWRALGATHGSVCWRRHYCASSSGDGSGDGADGRTRALSGADAADTPIMVGSLAVAIRGTEELTDDEAAELAAALLRAAASSGTAPNTSGPASPGGEACTPAAARVAAAVDAALLQRNDAAAGQPLPPPAHLGQLSSMLSVYASLGQAPGLEVQAHLARGVAAAAGGALGASAQQQLQLHLPSGFALAAWGAAPAPLPRALPELARAASRARVSLPEFWRALGALAACHAEVLPLAALVGLLDAGARVGVHDAALFDAVGDALLGGGSGGRGGGAGDGGGETADRTDSGGLPGSGGSRKGQGGAASQVARLRVPLAAPALVQLLRALATTRHADAPLLHAAAAGVDNALSGQVPLPPRRRLVDFLSGAPDLDQLPAGSPGCGFKLSELGDVAWALATLGHTPPRLMSGLSREAFAHMLQLIERQEQAVGGTQGQAARGTSAQPACWRLPQLAWGLSRAGHCQPVLLDAVALLLEPGLPALTPRDMLLLLHACEAVAPQSGGGNTRSDGDTSGGTAQLLESLAPEIAANVGSYSVRQAAAVARIYAAAGGSAGGAALGPAAAAAAAAAAMALPPLVAWGPLADVAASAAELRTRPDELMDAAHDAAAAALMLLRDHESSVGRSVWV
ncbi:hypothetical protein FOA52_011210 [Chlamydomonas sp. UWO 241]|nr:hypothetical protein FOA52_011210 [Chlamydomonas sp. UWO 241]